MPILSRTRIDPALSTKTFAAMRTSPSSRRPKARTGSEPAWWAKTGGARRRWRGWGRARGGTAVGAGVGWRWRGCWAAWRWGGWWWGGGGGGWGGGERGRGGGGGGGGGGRGGGG